MEAERALVSEPFPDLQLHVPADGTPPYWLGHIAFCSSVGKRYAFKVRIVYPPWEYPNDGFLPRVYDEDSAFAPHPGQSYLDRHIFEESDSGKRRFCLTLPDRKELVIRKPEDFINFLDAVTGYLEKQVIYDLNGGNWPGPDEPHGGVAFARFFLEEALGPRRQTGGEVFNRLLNMLYSERGVGPKVGRNMPCPCGSGKKAKKCHGGAYSAARSNLFRRLQSIEISVC